jgi:hypothetical protein
MNRQKIYIYIIIFLAGASFLYPQSEWREDSFEDFRDGTFLDAGSNAYVSAAGRIQMITRWDFNNDGYLDILLAAGHGHTEKENTFIYLNNGEDIDARSRIELPAAGTYDGLITDLNQDGYNDLAVVHISDSHVKRVPVWIYYGSEKGFLIANRIELPSEEGRAIVSGDFNNDSWPDIAVGSQYKDENVDTPVSIIYWNSPDGFSSDNKMYFSPNGKGAVALAAGDLDSDGADDLVALTTEKTFLFLTTNDNFSNTENLPVIEIAGRATDIGDYNGDSQPDLLICTKGKVVVFTGNGSGNFSLDNTVALAVSAPNDAVFADVDRDGLQDVVVANFAEKHGVTWTNSFVFYSDSKDFSSKEPLAIPTLGAAGVSCEDLNNDGYPEIVFSNERATRQNNVYSYVYWNKNGSFFFENHTQLPTLGSNSNAIGDVNNDSLPDIAFFNDEGYFRDGPTTSYLYWGDGTRNYSDKRRHKFLTHQVFGFGHADLDDDGNVDVIFARRNFHDGISHRQAGLSIQWNVGGDFKNPTPLTMTYGYGGVRIADINKDGYLDILSGGRCLDLEDNSKHGFPIFWGSKNGYSFKNRQLLHYTDQRVRGQLLMDLNKDGWLDISGQLEDGKVRFWWGSEHGFSDEAVTDLDLGRNDHLMYIKGADFNKDGWIDLLLPKRGNPDGTEESSLIFYGSQSGFDKNNSTEVSSYVAYQNTISDINKDGWLDILLTSYGGEVSGNRPSLIHWGSEDGFLPGRTELESYGSAGSEILDYDGDGWLDILIANHRKSGSYIEPLPHVHTTASMLYWGGPNGFSKENRWEAIVEGSSGSNLRDAGNSYDRGLYEDYFSSVCEIKNGETPSSISWNADTPHGTGVHFQIRLADAKEDISGAEWIGPDGENSWFKKSGSRINNVEGKFIQYRARLITPNGAATPYLTGVVIKFD